jgi:hypothetical protein
MFTVRLSGAPIGAPWEGTDWDGDSDWEITSAADDTPSSYTACGTAPSNGRARGSTRPW